MLMYKVQNLMNCEEKVFVHGCNSQGVMRSGVAKAVRETFPVMYEDYIKQHEINGLAVGEIIVCNLKPSATYGDFPTPHFGIDAITQEYYGREDKVYVSYTGIRTAFRRINRFMTPDLGALAIPKIGAGLARGDWSRIVKIIEDEMDCNVIVYVLDESEIPE
jgi:O-acetyl-ADP-ribose deacetylase (regulator of RNase III)